MTSVGVWDFFPRPPPHPSVQLLTSRFVTMESRPARKKRSLRMAASLRQAAVKEELNLVAKREVPDVPEPFSMADTDRPPRGVTSVQARKEATGEPNLELINPFLRSMKLTLNEKSDVDLCKKPSRDSQKIFSSEKQVSTLKITPQKSYPKWHNCRTAAVCSEQFHRLLQDYPDFQSCKSCLAAFVLEREVLDSDGEPCEQYEVVALGTGSSCCSSWLRFNGCVVHDCHAIVIARRALCRFLFKQLLLFFSDDIKCKEKSIYEITSVSPLLQVKPKTYLHLYTARIPKGAADSTLLSSCISQKLQCHVKGSLIPSSSVCPSVWAARICCMSASDKLSRWAVTGVQGALLSHFVEPFYITTVVLGDSIHHFEKASDAINKRLGEKWVQRLPQPFNKHEMMFFNGEAVGPLMCSSQCQKYSLNWCLGDTGVEVLDSATGCTTEGSPFVSGPGFSSRLCKRAFYMAFRKVAETAHRQDLLDLPTYRDAKMAAHLYQSAKTTVNEHFMTINAGPWNSKQLVDMFEPYSSVRICDGEKTLDA
ncbi:adenosine deaminase domain-containing protein 2 isoform X1 [Arapaima gigas]